jgi:hypothetical protein
MCSSNNIDSEEADAAIPYARIRASTSIRTKIWGEEPLMRFLYNIEVGAEPVD